MHKVQGPTKRTDRGSATFSMTIRLDRIPHCPICGSQLHGTVTRVRFGVAWCDTCTRYQSATHVAHVAAMAIPDLHLSITTQSGIIFWVPDLPTWTSVRSALDKLGIDSWGLDPNYPQPDSIGQDRVLVLELDRSYAPPKPRKDTLLHAYPGVPQR